MFKGLWGLWHFLRAFEGIIGGWDFGVVLQGSGLQKLACDASWCLYDSSTSVLNLAIALCTPTSRNVQFELEV